MQEEKEKEKKPGLLEEFIAELTEKIASIVSREIERFKQKFGLEKIQMKATLNEPYVKIWWRQPINIEVHELQWTVPVIFRNYNPYGLPDSTPKLEEFPTLHVKIAEFLAQKYGGTVVTWTQQTCDDDDEECDEEEECEEVYYLGITFENSNDTIEIGDED